MAYPLSQQGLCLNFLKLTGGKGAYGCQHLSKFAGKGGFTRARIAGKYEVIRNELVCSHSLLLFVLDRLDYGPYLILDALEADVAVQLGKNILLTLGNEAFLWIDVAGRHGFASAEGGPHGEILGHALCQVAIVVAKVRLAHVPCEMGFEPCGEVIIGLEAEFIFKKGLGELRKFLNAKRFQFEIKLKEAVDVRVMLQEVTHFVEHAAEDEHWSAFRGAHAHEELVQQYHVRGPGGWHQLLGIGYNKDTVPELADVFIEVSGEFGPFGSVNHLGRRFYNARGEHFTGNEAGNEVFARTGISQYKAVHSKARSAVGTAGSNLESCIQAFQHRQYGVLADKSLK